MADEGMNTVSFTVYGDSHDDLHAQARGRLTEYTGGREQTGGYDLAAVPRQPTFDNPCHWFAQVYCELDRW